MAAINSYTATSSVANDDYALLNGATNGTRRISMANLSSEMQRLAPAFTSASTASNISNGDYVLMVSSGTLYKIDFDTLVGYLVSAIEEYEEPDIVK